MASTTFTDNQSVIYAAWLNDVNSTVYNGTFQASIITPTNIVCNGSVSGTGFTGLVNNTLGSPSAIGNVVPNTGAFTTLSSSGVASLNSATLTNALTIANGGTGLNSAGAAGSVLTSNGTSWSIAPKITSGTAQASTSGTSITFTGIPSWVKRITMMFNGVSLSGTSSFLIQIGSGSVTTTGYQSSASISGASTSGISSTAGFVIYDGANASQAWYGITTLCLLSNNTWVSSSSGGLNIAFGSSGGGVSPSLSGALDRIVITTTNGTDTFDAGSINILYE